MFSALVEPIRGIKLAIVSGVVWLTAVWLLFGNQVLDAIGRDCGSPSSAGCVAQQSESIHLIVVAIVALGPVAATLALAIAATIVGGTANFVLACLAAAVWRPKDDPKGLRKTKRVELIELLMGWATSVDLVDHAEWTTEWQEAQRIRGEGLTRIATFPGLVLIACTLAVRVSPVYWLAAILVLAILADGVVAIVRSASMYDDLRKKRSARESGAV